MLRKLKFVSPIKMNKARDSHLEKGESSGFLSWISKDRRWVKELEGVNDTAQRCNL